MLRVSISILKWSNNSWIRDANEMQLKYATFGATYDCTTSASGSLIPVSWTLECIGTKVDTVTQYQTDCVHILTESKEKRLLYVNVKVVRPNVIGAK